jgi:hypothetical protein
MKGALESSESSLTASAAPSLSAGTDIKSGLAADSGDEGNPDGGMDDARRAWH